MKPRLWFILILSALLAGCQPGVLTKRLASLQATYMPVPNSQKKIVVTIQHVETQLPTQPRPPTEPVAPTFPATITPLPTETFTPTATAIPLPTATIRPTPAPLVGGANQGQTISSVCMEVKQRTPDVPENFREPIEASASQIMELSGIQVLPPGSACEATLTFDLELQALGRQFTTPTSVYCYAGSSAAGRASLALSGKSPESVTLRYEEQPPYAIQSTQCGKTPQDAPFHHAWKSVLLQGMAHFWGASVLLQSLQSEDTRISYAAEQLLTENPSTDYLPALIQGLQSSHPRTRNTAMKAIGALGPQAKDAIPALIAMFYDPDPSGWTQGNAADALGKIGAAALPDLVELLDDENGQVRYSAVSALEGIGKPSIEALPKLIPLLEDESHYLRGAVLRVLFAIGPAAGEATPAVIPLLDDPEETVVWFALQALGGFGSAAKEALPAIFERLDRFSMSNQFQAFDTLKAITGQDIAPDAAAWKAWWASQP